MGRTIVEQQAGAAEIHLVSWVGRADLEAAEGLCSGFGPLASTLRVKPFARVHLLYSYPLERVESYLSWLRDQVSAPLQLVDAPLSSPINYQEIYQQADSFLSSWVVRNPKAKLAMLLSPGTPAMQSVWLLLGKTKYPAIFYQSSIEQGLEQVDIPFEISAEFIPAKAAQQLSSLVSGLVPIDAAFDDIVTQNADMQLLKQQASILAQYELPVLIYGESGTGKELFATAIHTASPRAGKSLVVLNCGAIPPELIESTLFGHKKGAFTGADSNRLGVFQQAQGGTLFLDEFGELSEAVQVRLLRALQFGEVTPVGADRPDKVDVRIIAATNKDLLAAVAQGTFREDLFYRVAIGVLKLPPLRQRTGDVLLLAERLLANISASLKLAGNKKISVEAKNFILKQPWRGNIRELQATLLRACLWSTDTEISAQDFQQALFAMPDTNQGIMARNVSQGIDIQELISELVQHYIPLALAEAKDNKTKAAELLGLKNYQTLNNWIEKYGVN